MILEPIVLGDDRGYFLESYNKKSLKKQLGRYHLCKIMNRNPLKGC